MEDELDEREEQNLPFCEDRHKNGTVDHRTTRQIPARRPYGRSFGYIPPGKCPVASGLTIFGVAGALPGLKGYRRESARIIRYPGALSCLRFDLYGTPN
jgi:hypothetical protein